MAGGTQGAGPPESLDGARIRRLEDIEEIKQLKIRYFEACDGGFGGMPTHEPDAVAAVFTDDGVWDGGPLGTCVGRDAIRARYEQVPQGFAYTMLSSPKIDVDGDVATGRWHLMVYAMSSATGSNGLTGGEHHDEYIRTTEGWRIARTTFVSAVRAESPVPWNPPANHI